MILLFMLKYGLKKKKNAFTLTLPVIVCMPFAVPFEEDIIHMVLLPSYFIFSSSSPSIIVLLYNGGTVQQKEAYRN